MPGVCGDSARSRGPVAPAAEPEGNPLLAEFDTPFKVPPFGKIRTEHYLPAFQEALARHKKEIGAIAENEALPTFENTLEALDRSGELLRRLKLIFRGLVRPSFGPVHRGLM